MSGEGLFAGQCKADLVSFRQSVRSLQNNACMLYLLNVIRHARRYDIKTLSYDGALCDKQGRAQDGGNRAYSVVFCAVAEIAGTSTAVQDVIRDLQQVWPSLTGDYHSAAATEWKGDIVESLLSL
jgi:hypothetical protein